MPIDFEYDKKIIRLLPTTSPQKIKLKKLKRTKSYQIFDNKFFITIKEDI